VAACFAKIQFIKGKVKRRKRCAARIFALHRGIPDGVILNSRRDPQLQPGCARGAWAQEPS
jgi:hypothetical protein